jgi:TetR/AcrR family transcriptional regulator, repressor of fatR-cypB operon
MNKNSLYLIMRIKDSNKINNIFKASLDLIYADGLSGLTMAKIANEAKIATGTLYIYFKNKKELISELYISLRRDSVERFLEGYSENLPFKIAIKTVWINYLNHRIEHYKESVFMEQYYRSPFITEEHLLLSEAMKAPVHKIIQRGKREMLVKNDIDDEMLFLSMLGFIRELADEHVTNVYKLNDERIEKAFNLSWDTIKA